MATESSAVVRFINLAQQSQNRVLPTQPAPITSEFGTEVLQREVDEANDCGRFRRHRDLPPGQPGPAGP
jgi:hypothetical protein